MGANMHVPRAGVLCAVVIACATGLADAQTYSIPSYTIDGGGGRSQDGPFVLTGFIGKPEGEENLSSGPFSMRGGFIPRVPPQLFGVAFTEGQLVRLDLATGAGTLIGPTKLGQTVYNLRCAAADAADRILSIRFTNQLLQIDPVTAALSVFKDLSNAPAGGTAIGLAIDHNDAIFVLLFGQTSDLLYRLDPTPDDPTRMVYASVGPLGVTGTRGLAFSPSGVLYAFNHFRGLMIVNQSTGAATAINEANPPDLESLEFDPTTGICYAAKFGLWQIDPATGALTDNLGDTGYDVRGTAFIRRGRSRIGDCDGDGDAGLADWSILVGCLSGPGAGANQGCSRADDGADDDVDLRDVATFQAILRR